MTTMRFFLHDFSIYSAAIQHTCVDIALHLYNTNSSILPKQIGRESRDQSIDTFIIVGLYVGICTC